MKAKFELSKKSIFRFSQRTNLVEIILELSRIMIRRFFLPEVRLRSAKHHFIVESPQSYLD